MSCHPISRRKVEKALQLVNIIRRPPLSGDIVLPRLVPKVNLTTAVFGLRACRNGTRTVPPPPSAHHRTFNDIRMLIISILTCKCFLLRSSVFFSAGGVRPFWSDGASLRHAGAGNGGVRGKPDRPHDGRMRRGHGVEEAGGCRGRAALSLATGACRAAQLLSCQANVPHHYKKTRLDHSLCINRRILVVGMLCLC